MLYYYFIIIIFHLIPKSVKNSSAMSSSDSFVGPDIMRLANTPGTKIH